MDVICSQCKDMQTQEKLVEKIVQLSLAYDLDLKKNLS